VTEIEFKITAKRHKNSKNAKTKKKHKKKKLRQTNGRANYTRPVHVQEASSVIFRFWLRVLD